ncbi:hypothetical protein FF011L_44760 [Roseimaritima multifibrata]|uniref:Uncharacterized protein n=1 Tax=Roseimaritima multifibrata TaxID=1930274 RepID=A0A517MLA3_9BACT|nr:hypothetical protein [Roseimaritima multifibrata]QDS95676.1 hypothetical protein FF011L_44760 [Roseimaritima multifibrata]
MTEHSPKPVSENSGGKALRNGAIVVLLLVAFTPLRSVALPIALVAVLVGFGYVFHRVLRFNRSGGIALIATATTMLCVYLALVYRAELRHQTLLSHLNAYGNVTVRRNAFPFPHVHQLSIGDGVANSDLTTILRLDGLDQLTHLYLDNDILTDTCLQDAAKISGLEYIAIDCDRISDDAILQFETRFPECRVIPQNRNWHDPQTVFLGTPPDEG